MTMVQVLKKNICRPYDMQHLEDSSWEYSAVLTQVQDHGITMSAILLHANKTNHHESAIPMEKE